MVRRKFWTDEAGRRRPLSGKYYSDAMTPMTSAEPPRIVIDDDAGGTGGMEFEGPEHEEQERELELASIGATPEDIADSISGVDVDIDDVYYLPAKPQDRKEEVGFELG